MKKKIYSLLLMICMCFCFLTGCSLTYTDNSYKDNDVVMTVGTTEITRKELVDQYSSFYSQYYQYFMYYDSAAMMDLFYNAVVNRAIILEKANDLLGDGTTGSIRFYAEDYKDIWDSIYDNINAQLDTKEKAILLESSDTDEEDLPVRLQDDEDDETVYVYPEYSFKTLSEKDEYKEVEKYKTTVGDLAPDFMTMYNSFKDKEMYRFITSEDDAEETTYEYFDSEKPLSRIVAFNKYLEDLIINAKAEGKTHDAETVFKTEVERLYKTYYESTLYEKYQRYVEYDVADPTSEYLSDDVIARKFIELTNKDNQSNSSEDSYAKVITSTDNESLILYHYDGEYKYFTVHHILLQFESSVSEMLKEHPGAIQNINNIYREEYKAYREGLVLDLYGSVLGMTTTSRDEDGKTVANSKVTAEEIIQEWEDGIKDIEDNGQDVTVRDKTLLFNKLAWKYSDDPGLLTEKLSGKLGYTIPDEKDNHGSFVVDFAIGARTLYDRIKNNGVEVGEEILPVLSDHGLHLMMVTGVYEPGNLLPGQDDLIGDDNNYLSTDVIITALQANYVSNLTEQRLYDYFYDMVADTLVGDSGTYFSKHRNKLYSDYEDEGKISYNQKMSYSELSSAIGV